MYFIVISLIYIISIIYHGMTKWLGSDHIFVHNKFNYIILQEEKMWENKRKDRKILSRPQDLLRQKDLLSGDNLGLEIEY